MGKFQSTYDGVITTAEVVSLKDVVSSLYMASGRDDPLVGAVLRHLYDNNLVKNAPYKNIPEDD